MIWQLVDLRRLIASQSGTEMRFAGSIRGIISYKNEHRVSQPSLPTEINSS